MNKISLVHGGGMQIGHSGGSSGGRAYLLLDLFAAR